MKNKHLLPLLTLIFGVLALFFCAVSYVNGYAATVIAGITIGEEHLTAIKAHMRNERGFNLVEEIEAIEVFLKQARNSYYRATIAPDLYTKLILLREASAFSQEAANLSQDVITTILEMEEYDKRPTNDCVGLFLCLIYC